MSSLTGADKQILEAVFGMKNGYVLDFSDPAFADFFNSYGVDIHSTQYQDKGTSKAKRLRSFWEKEPDKLVGQVLSDLLDVCEVLYSFDLLERDTVALEKSRATVARLLVNPHEGNFRTSTGVQSGHLEVPDISNLPVDPAVS